jgi:hypothetical protein
MMCRIWNKATKKYITIEKVTYIFNDLNTFKIEVNNNKQTIYHKDEYDLDFIHEV